MNIAFENDFSSVNIDDNIYNLYPMEYNAEENGTYSAKYYLGFKNDKLNSQDVVIYTKIQGNNKSIEYITLLNNFINTEYSNFIKKKQ